MADLSVPQMQSVLTSAAAYKRHFKTPGGADRDELGLGSMPLRGKTIALMFSKRSTRTRVASESSVAALGGHPLFLGSADIQLGVNESLYDTSRVVGSMVDGIMARVGDHSEVEVRGRASDSLVLRHRRWPRRLQSPSSTPSRPCTTRRRSWPTCSR